MAVPFGTVYHFFPDIDDTRRPDLFPDIRDAVFWEVFERCRPYSLLPVERFYNIYKSIEYITSRDVPGDFVECGVFLGGSAMAMAMFSEHFGATTRRVHLYDTFTGFMEGIVERNASGVEEVFPQLPDFLESVEQAIAQLGLRRGDFEIVQGPVEKTLHEAVPDTISLARLDTDYYESSLVELEVLYPILSTGGVLIVDDYGHFEGVREATDQYLDKTGTRMLLNRIDYSCRAGIKP